MTFQVVTSSLVDMLRTASHTDAHLDCASEMTTACHLQSTSQASSHDVISRHRASGHKLEPSH